MIILSNLVKNILIFALFSCTTALFADTQQRFFGVNLAGADFGTGQNGENLPGTFGREYIYPNQDEVDYFASKRMNIVRLPFRWERLQKSLNDDFDSAELNRLKSFVDTTTEKGVFVLLDPHNYARYHGNVIGTNTVPFTAFADFWGRLADLFKDNPRVIFGLMNEPSRMRTDQWREAANIAIAEIRERNAGNLILVPGNGFTGGHSWLKNFYADESPNSSALGPNGYRVGSNAEEMLNIVDPLNNYAFDIHQYLDSDFSGTNTSCVDATIGSRSLAEVTTWMRKHNQRAFLGEFGGGRGSTCLDAIRNITTYMNDRPDVWIGWSYWAAGPWWDEYFSTLEPLNISGNNPTDRPQLASLVFSFTPVIPKDVALSLESQNFTFTSELGLTYQVQTTTTLEQNDWSNVGAPISGNGSLLQIGIPGMNTSEVQRFYRLRVVAQ